MKKEELVMRESFIFYLSFHNAIKLLPKKTQADVYNEICEYGLTGKPINYDALPARAKMALLLVEPQLRANFMRYENGTRGGMSGHLGGAPRGNSNAKKQPRNNPKTTPKQPLMRM